MNIPPFYGKLNCLLFENTHWGEEKKIQINSLQLFKLFKDKGIQKNKNLGLSFQKMINYSFKR